MWLQSRAATEGSERLVARLPQKGSFSWWDVQIDTQSLALASECRHGHEYLHTHTHTCTHNTHAHTHTQIYYYYHHHYSISYYTAPILAETLGITDFSSKSLVNDPLTTKLPSNAGTMKTIDRLRMRWSVGRVQFVLVCWDIVSSVTYAGHELAAIPLSSAP